MTHKQHLDQRNAVRAALLLSEDRVERHGIYSRAERQKCQKCHLPNGLLFCSRCDLARAA